MKYIRHSSQYKKNLTIPQVNKLTIENLYESE